MRNMRRDMARLMRAVRRQTKPRSRERTEMIRQMRGVVSLAERNGAYKLAA